MKLVTFLRFSSSKIESGIAEIYAMVVASAQGSRVFERLNKVILASVRDTLLGFSRMNAK
jgi:hypothetical protein